MASRDRGNYSGGVGMVCCEGGVECATYNYMYQYFNSNLSCTPFYCWWWVLTQKIFIHTSQRCPNLGQLAVGIL